MIDDLEQVSDSPAGIGGGPVDDAGRFFDPDLDQHPSREVLWSFMAGGLPAGEKRQAFRHLVHGCPRCRALASEVWNLAPFNSGSASPAATAQAEPEKALASPAQGAEPLSTLTAGLTPEAPQTPQATQPLPNSEYDLVLDRVFSSVSLQEAAIEAARQRARGLFEELMQHLPARQCLLVHNSTRFRDRLLCENLLAASHESGFREPARSQQLARLAVEIAERLSESVDCSVPSDTSDTSGVTDSSSQLDLLTGLQARAWAQLGNALRIGADLEGAGHAFRAAEALLAANQRVALLDKAKVLDLKASLCRDSRQLVAAERLLDRVIAIHRRLGQSSLLGRALNQKGMVLAEAGNTAGSIDLLRRALELLDPQEDPRWFLTVRHNLIFALVADGRPREAFALLFATRPLYLKMGDRMNLLRLRWVEGTVARALDRLDQAEAAFREVRDAFLELGIAYDAALVSLDLAAVLAQQGKAADVRRLAVEMMAVFESRQIHREAMAAFMFFCDAARREQAGLKLVQEVASFLKQARNAPDLRFSPSG